LKRDKRTERTDRNIPAETQKFMAERAGARKTIAVEGGSHALMVSHPDKVAALIEDASSARWAWRSGSAGVDVMSWRRHVPPPIKPRAKRR
jgi:hypothetical protein